MRWFGWFRRSSDKKQQATPYTSPLALSGGRLRARGIAYQLPRDLDEMNRLDFQHFITRQGLHGNYVAPIDQPQSILDLGTGTGRWAREMAQSFPQANVIGLDITPPPMDQATEAGIWDVHPPNYSFVTGNMLERLPFADASFDFVHIRYVVAAIPHDRWPFVASEMVRVTRPGGWIESIEGTAVEHGGPAMDQIVAWFTDTIAVRGVQYADGARIGEWLRAAGLPNVTVQILRSPVGAHGGRVGNLVAADYLLGMKSLEGMIVARDLTTPETFEATLAQATADLNSTRVKCVVPVYITYGQCM